MKRIIRIGLFVLAAAFAAPEFSAIADDRVETVAAESSVRSVEGGILLSATERKTFEVYSITGQKVKSLIVEGSSVKVDLPKGCYIVRTADWSKKVVVK